MLTETERAQMRITAQQFMTTVVTLFEPIINYDMYGQQILTSGNVVQVSGYVGRLSGSDRELLDGLLGRNGVETKSIATLLLPYQTTIHNNYRVIVGNTTYNVVWNNNDTSDAFQVYTKAIMTQLDRGDEAEWHT